jgi:endonuclease-3
MSRRERDPFKILISTILSLRTKDETTRDASIRLFAVADTPHQMLKIPAGKIEKLIYPVGFYRTKTRTILETCRTLIDKYGGKVPDTLDELLTLKGVGRKTANLVITLGFDKYGICVDTHVHRISNRLGLIRTKNPEESEFALRKILPKKYWKTYNDVLVTYGQNLCKPISPWCSRCPVESLCDKVGVEKTR